MTTTRVMKPDEAALRGNLQSVAFLAGEAEGRWSLADPPGITWPHVVFWIAAAPRKGAPDRFHLRLNCAGYPSQSPTGMLWDLTKGTQLALSEYPKGTGDTAKVYRIDWPSENATTGDKPGSALYHPFDRRPMSDHPDWKKNYPHQQWHSRRTIVDYLEMAYGLLNCPTYHGIK
jgi:hypothetical protein